MFRLTIGCCPPGKWEGLFLWQWHLAVQGKHLIDWEDSLMPRRDLEIV